MAAIANIFDITDPNRVPNTIRKKVFAAHKRKAKKAARNTMSVKLGKVLRLASSPVTPLQFEVAALRSKVIDKPYKGNGINVILQNMVAEGEAVRVSRGLYLHPSVARSYATVSI